VKAVDMGSMTRVAAIYARNDVPTRGTPTILPEKSGKVVLSATRSATQAAAVIVILAVIAGTLSSRPLVSQGATIKGQSHGPATESLPTLDEVTLDEFVESYLPLRDDLALRSLEGELNEAEIVRLRELNARLRQLLPSPSPPPADVVNAIAEVRRLLGA
jgi:hypothetical protein